MEFRKDLLQLRLYQETILNTASKYNTLVILPTGLGKTHIAIALANLRLASGKVLMVAPTKPLVNQHLKTFSEFFRPTDNICALSGDTTPEKRQALWGRSEIILSTPQTIKFDVISGRISLRDVSLLIIDEAHRSSGDYAYVFLTKAYNKQSANPRILALTASPGDDTLKINEICSNLFIEKVEARSREHSEVKEYVKETKVSYCTVELPEPFKVIKHCLELAIKKRFEALKLLNVIHDIDAGKLTRKHLIALQGALQHQLKSQKPEIYRALSVLAAVMKLQHALTLIESESVAALNAYFKDMWDKSRTTATKALKDITTDTHVRIAYQKSLDLAARGIEHPKLEFMKNLIQKQIAEKPDSKILVFTEYRNNVGLLVSKLDECDNVNAHKFIGQSSKSEKGMSQKVQIETIERLKSGDINVLVCTSVAEEGLDIPSVDLVVFYSPTPSVIRTIQRRGRTGRHSIGRLAVLIAKDTKDERYYWVTKHKEARMNIAIGSVSRTMQPNLKSYAGGTAKQAENKVVVFADARERGVIIDYLFEAGANVRTGNLKAGDFILSDDVGVERKEIKDFVDSLIDGRLFSQAKQLKENFKRPLYILEGEFSNLFTARNVSSSALWSSLLAVLLDWQIPLIYAASPRDTANIILTIAKREQLDYKKPISIRGDSKPKTLDQQQQYLIEGLPLVGPTLAKRLLSVFKTPLNILNATVDELKNIEGLGEGKAEVIKQLLEREYINKLN